VAPPPPMCASAQPPRRHGAVVGGFAAPERARRGGAAVGPQRGDPALAWPPLRTSVMWADGHEAGLAAAASALDLGFGAPARELGVRASAGQWQPLAKGKPAGHNPIGASVARVLRSLPARRCVHTEAPCSGFALGQQAFSLDSRYWNEDPMHGCQVGIKCPILHAN
jgi:hypothetical protein